MEQELERDMPEVDEEKDYEEEALKAAKEAVEEMRNDDGLNQAMQHGQF